MTDVEEIQSRVSCPDLCEELGIELDIHGRTPCFHDGLDAHSNRSVDVDERLFYCHRCGRGGTVIDLLMQATGCSFYKACLQLESFAENKPAKVAKAEPKPVVTFTLEDVKITTMTPEHNEYRKRRYGWQMWDPANNVYPVGGAFAFVYGDPDMVRGVKYRTLHTNLKYSLPGSRFDHLWSTQTDGYGRKTVICEGETDALALAQWFRDAHQTVAVKALPAGASTIREEWFGYLLRTRSPGDVYVCMDNDTAGKIAASKILRISHWQWNELKVPGLYNDAEEALRNGWAPSLV